VSLKSRGRFLDLCALGASLALAVIFSLPRLPQSTDFILPRRPLFFLYRLGVAIAGSARGRQAADWCAVALLIFCAAVLLTGLWRWGKWPGLFCRGNRRRGLACLAGLCLGLISARWAASLYLDLIQNVWFFPENANVLEPLLVWAAFFAPLALFLRASEAVLEWSPWRCARFTAVLLAPALVLQFWAVRLGDTGKQSLAEAAGLAQRPRQTRAIVVLTEKQGHPDYEVHELELGVRGTSEFSPESLAKVEDYVRGRRTVFTLAGLRYLYAGHTMQMDAAAARQALCLGAVVGDPAGRLLLLENLEVAPPGPEAESCLSSLSNEARYRIGQQGAARLAQAWTHLGFEVKAAYWKKRASTGPDGIPEGLLEPSSPGGPLTPGEVRGRIADAPGPLRAALYVRRDPQGSYILGPTWLVDSVIPDERGRFDFKGLTAGAYFLAFSVDMPDGAAPHSLNLNGEIGDIHLSEHHPSVELPTIHIKL
jgi:hypothetical protein